MDVTVHTVNAFVDNQAAPDTGGNPAGVVLAADGIDARQRQALAARLGLSETVFVGASATAWLACSPNWNGFIASATPMT